MDSIYFEHFSNESRLYVPLSEFSSEALLRFEYEGKSTLLSAESKNEFFLIFSVKHSFLISIENFSRLFVFIDVNELSAVLSEIENYSSLFDCFNVDTPEVFWARVSTTARPIRNEYLLRFLCKRAVLKHSDFSIFGAAVCALGYRILDSNTKEDPDLSWFLEYSSFLLNWRGEVSPYEDARWGTSVLMVLAYYYINIGDFSIGVLFLHKILNYRSSIKFAPLIQTNLVRSSLILADYYMDFSLYTVSLCLLKEVPLIARDGVWWSDLEGDPVAAMYKYTEFEVVLCAAREASKLIERYVDIEKKQQRKLIRLQDLGGYVSILSRRGKFNYAC